MIGATDNVGDPPAKQCLESAALRPQAGEKQPPSDVHQ